MTFFSYRNGSNVLWIVFLGLTVCYLKNCHVSIWAGKLHLVDLYTSNIFERYFPRLYRLRRKYLPSFVYIKYYDCDSGGQCFAGNAAFVWNDRELCRIADAETSFEYITAKQYFAWLFRKAVQS